MAEVSVVCDLHIGKVDVSCDMVLCELGGQRLMMLAVEKPSAVELHHSPSLTFEPAGGDIRDVLTVMYWLRNAALHPYILKNCRVVNSEDGEESFMQELILTMTDPGRLLPSAVKETNEVDAALAVVSTAHGEHGGRVSTVQRADGKDGLAVLCCRAAMSDLHSLSVPALMSRVSGTKVGGVLYMLGKSMSQCFDPYRQTLPPLDTSKGSTPAAFKNTGQLECGLMHLMMFRAKLPHGIHSMVPSPICVGRLHVGASGIRVSDVTGKRLVVFVENNMSTLVMMCGCLVRNGLKFERAHVPLLLSPKLGMEFVFGDDPAGVSLSIDGRQAGLINTENRQRHNGFYWLEFIATSSDATESSR
jgi:hypothetical protein